MVIGRGVSISLGAPKKAPAAIPQKTEQGPLKPGSWHRALEHAQNRVKIFCS